MKIRQQVVQVQFRDILRNKTILVARVCLLCIFNIFTVFSTCVRGLTFFQEVTVPQNGSFVDPTCTIFDLTRFTIAKLCITKFWLFVHQSFVLCRIDKVRTYIHIAIHKFSRIKKPVFEENMLKVHKETQNLRCHKFMLPYTRLNFSSPPFFDDSRKFWYLIFFGRHY